MIIVTLSASATFKGEIRADAGEARACSCYDKYIGPTPLQVESNYGS